MILTEYDEELHIRSEKQISWEEGEKEGWENGREDGRKEEKKRFVKSLLQRGGFSDEELASLAQLPLEKILEIKEECDYGNNLHVQRQECFTGILDTEGEGGCGDHDEFV